MINANTSLSSFVGHEFLKPAKRPGVHLSLGTSIDTSHPVTNMVKLLEHDGIYIMVKRFLDNGFRHTMDIVFGEAVFSSFQALESALGATSAFSLKTTPGAKVSIALPVVETSIKELACRRNSDVIDAKINAHNDASLLEQDRLANGDVQEEHPTAVRECSGTHFVVGIVKMLSLVIPKNIVGPHSSINRSKCAIAILNRNSALVVDDGTEVSKGGLAGLALVGPLNNASLYSFGNTIASRAYEVSREVGGLTNRVVGSVMQRLFGVVLALAVPSHFKHNATSLIELAERLKQIANSVLRNVQFNRDSLSYVVHIREGIISHTGVLSSGRRLAHSSPR